MGIPKLRRGERVGNARYGERYQPHRYGGSDGPVNNLGPNATTLAVSTQKTIPANYLRTGLELWIDPAATGEVYILLGPGTPSATNYHIALGVGGSGPGFPSWDGQIGQVVWSGAIQLIASTGTIHVGVAEV